MRAGHTNGLGDKHDLYAGIGRNGAQTTPEAGDTTLQKAFLAPDASRGRLDPDTCNGIEKGGLMGINSLLVADATGRDRHLPGNMFVPVDLLRPILAELQQSGNSLKSHRPWLGLTSSDQGGRIQIVRFSEVSPAQLAGLEVGDMVLAVDGAKVTTL